MATAADSHVDNMTNNQFPGNYLFLPDNPFPHLQLSNIQYVLYLSPMNSSPDIYHIITYLMLSKYEKKQLLFIQFTSDEQTTFESPAECCIQFATNLGVSDRFFSPANLDKGNSRSSDFKVINYFQNKYGPIRDICYIEQKLLTTLISYYFIRKGREQTSKILNELYAQWSVDDNINKTIRANVKKEIQKKFKSKSFIILQCHYSSKVNKNQNIDDIEIQRS
jgi:hypothetical protein